jgi:transcriptional regulator with XRE-family HTH domain
MLVMLMSPPQIVMLIARQARARRLDRGWTQAELVARSTVALHTLKKFERTGQISLPRVVRLAIVLGASREMERLFSEKVPASLDALERRKRQRGSSPRKPRSSS